MVSTESITRPKLAQCLVMLRNTLLGASLFVVLISWRLSFALFAAGALVSGAAWLLAGVNPPAASVSAECRR